MFVKRERAVAEQPRRTLPRQERSRQRLAAILDAAEVVIGQAGYEAATTEEIARRASTSIGSFYRYFLDKEALLQVLVERYLEQLRAVFDRTLSPEAARLPVADVLDRVVDGLVELKSAHPAFWSLMHRGAAPDELPPPARELHREMRDRVAAVFALRAPALSAEDRALYADVSVSAVEALLPVALDSPEPYRGRVLAELKRMLVGYLDPLLAAGPAGRSGSSRRREP
jgi:AcrR family transcriptional regulator